MIRPVLAPAGPGRDVPVRGVVRSAVVTVDPDATVVDPACLLWGETVGCAFVVEDGRLVGIVTLDDLLRLLADEFGRLAEVVEAESPS